MRVVLASFFVILFVFSSGVLASPRSELCKVSLKSKESNLNFEHLIEKLISENILNELVIREWIASIETGSPLIEAFRGALAINHSVSDSEKYYKSLPLEALLRYGQVPRPALLERLRATSEELHEEVVVKEDAAEDVKTYFYKPKWVPIKPGEFTFYSNEERRDITIQIPHPLLVLDVPVTQLMWLQTMGHILNGNNLSHELVNEVEVDGKTFNIHPEHPVTSLTWYVAALFSNELSRQNDLSPAYAFEFSIEADQEAIETLNLPNNLSRSWVESVSTASGGMIVDEEGFRLPTSSEQRYLISLLSQESFEDKRNQIVHFDNSGGRLQPVASKAATRVNGGDLYDLGGNILEWTSDDTFELEPIGAQGNSRQTFERTVYGYNFILPIANANVEVESRRSVLVVDEPEEYVGFRLVRTLTPEEYFELTGEEL